MKTELLQIYFQTTAEQPFCAVPITKLSNSALIRRLVYEQKAWHIQGSVVQSISASQHLEYDNHSEILFSCKEGPSLFDILESPEKSDLEKLKTLQHLIQALQLLQIKPNFRLHPTGIFFLSDGSVFLLPQELMDFYIAACPIGYRIKTYDCFIHPDLTGELSISYSTACLIYKVLSGQSVFEENNLSLLQEKFRKYPATPLSFFRQAIHPDISGLLTDALSIKNRLIPSLCEWENFLQTWHEENVFGYFPDGPLQKKFIRKRQAFRYRANLKFYTQQFIKKNQRILLVIGIALFFAGIIGLPALKNFLAPASTLNMQPLQIVKHYYSSMDTLDYMRMQDCLIGNAGTRDIDIALHLNYFQRAGKKNKWGLILIPVKEWKPESNQSLLPNEHLYGISDLNITQEQNNIFSAQYNLWMPAFSEEEKQLVFPDTRATCNFRKDTLFIVQNRKQWRIRKVQRVSRMLPPLFPNTDRNATIP